MEQDTFYKVCWGLLGFFVFGVLLSLVFMNSTSYYEKQEYNTLKPLEQNVPSEAKPEAISHYEEMRDESVRATEELNKEPVNDTAVPITDNLTGLLTGGRFTQIMIMMMVANFVLMVVGIFSDNLRLGHPTTIIPSIIIATALLIMVPSLDNLIIAVVSVAFGIVNQFRMRSLFF